MCHIIRHINGSATIIWRIIGKIPLLEVASNCMLDARTIGRRIANVQSHIFIFLYFFILQSYKIIFNKDAEKYIQFLNKQVQK